MEFGSFATLSWGLRTSHTETKRLLFFSRTGSARKTPDFEKDTEKSSSAAGGSPQNNKKPAYPAAKLVGLILVSLRFSVTLLFLKLEGLSVEAIAVLASTLWIATVWIMEPVPIPVPWLLPSFLLPITGSLDGDTVVSSYGNDIIFLFLG